MKYKLLGKSGLRVSELCLGTMTFGEDWGWGSNKEESRKIFDAFLNAGGNFIDTANLYTNGTSESYLGEFMEGRRECVALATKYTNSAPGNDPNAGGNQRKNMMQSVEASLKRLKTDYIDLYWMHIWDGMTPVEEVMRAFDDLVRQGKVLYVGVSDAPAWWVAQANTIANLRGWTPFVGLQVEYSLIERTPERELLPMAQALGLTVTAWSPLAGGVLTGKYLTQNGQAGKSDGARLDLPDMQQFFSYGNRTTAIVQEVMAIAQEVGRTPAQVALAWLRQRFQPIIPIIGAKKLHQFKDNLANLDLILEPKLLDRLTSTSQIELGFPYEFYTKDMVRTFVYGGMRDLIEA
ncbi:MAG: aldo/keto reductase [Nitrospira sp. SG-bin1]|nr:MAG: aldo/keto reductase [Nitrospira sp. SG-bin1]